MRCPRSELSPPYGVARNLPTTSGLAWKQISTSTSVTRKALGSAAQAKTPIACCGQYFPKGLDLAAQSQAELNKVACQFNERPRKTLDFQSPAERFSQCVAATGTH